MALNLRDPRLPKEVVNDCAPKVGYEKFSCINFKQLNSALIKTDEIQALTAGGGVEIPFTFNNNMTATPSGTAANSVVADARYNFVTTVASPGDSVVLPVPTVENMGKTYRIEHLDIAGGENLKIWAPTGSTLVSHISNLISVPSLDLFYGAAYEFTQVSLTAYELTKRGALNISHIQDIGANSLGGQANATEFSYLTGYVSVSGAADNASVKFESGFFQQPATAHPSTIVQNRGGYIVDVYPSLGGSFSGLGANSPISLRPGEAIYVQAIGNNVARVVYINVNIGLGSFAGTATPGGGQPNALQIPLGAARTSLTTVATAGDSARLPDEDRLNVLYSVRNTGVAPADLYPTPGSDLGAGIDIAVSIPNNGKYYTFVSLGGGNFELVNSRIKTVDTSVTADPGSSQGDGLIPIGQTYTNIDTIGTAGDAVTLPNELQIGEIYVVENSSGGGDPADIFPVSGADLGQGVNTALSLADGDMAKFMSIGEGNYVQVV